MCCLPQSLLMELVRVHCVCVCVYARVFVCASFTVLMVVGGHVHMCAH